MSFSKFESVSCEDYNVSVLKFWFYLSFKPPVFRAIGMEPYLIAIICARERIRHWRLANI